MCVLRPHFSLVILSASAQLSRGVDRTELKGDTHAQAADARFQSLEVKVDRIEQGLKMLAERTGGEWLDAEEVGTPAVLRAVDGRARAATRSLET